MVSGGNTLIINDKIPIETYMEMRERIVEIPNYTRKVSAVTAKYQNNKNGPLIFYLPGFSAGLNIHQYVFNHLGAAEAMNATVVTICGGDQDIVYYYYGDAVTTPGFEYRATFYKNADSGTGGEGQPDATYNEIQSEIDYITAVYTHFTQNLGYNPSKVMLGGASNGGHFVAIALRMLAFPFVDTYILNGVGVRYTDWNSPDDDPTKFETHPGNSTNLQSNATTFDKEIIYATTANDPYMPPYSVTYMSEKLIMEPFSNAGVPFTQQGDSEEIINTDTDCVIVKKVFTNTVGARFVECLSTAPDFFANLYFPVGLCTFQVNMGHFPAVLYINGEKVPPSELTQDKINSYAGTYEKQIIMTLVNDDFKFSVKQSQYYVEHSS